MTIPKTVPIQDTINAIRKAPPSRISRTFIQTNHKDAIKRDVLKKLHDDLGKKVSKHDVLVVVVVSNPVPLPDPKLAR